MPKLKLTRFAVVLAALGATVAVCAFATAAPSATPAPSPAAKLRPLKEIGHVRALGPFCSQVVRHANSAIDTALSNDTRIAFTISDLRTIQLDDTVLQKANGTQELLKRYADLHAAATAGEAQVKELRLDADSATDPDQKAALKRLADALGGTVFRQKKLADQLGSYVTYADNHPRLDENDKDRSLTEIMMLQNMFGTPFRGDPRQYVPPTLTELAHTAADRFVEDEQAIGVDESTAADRVEPALKGC
jgi:hypothetical protein